MGLRAILPALARAPQALRGGGGSRDLSGFILPAPCELPHGKAPGPGHLPSPGPTKGAGPSGMPQVKASTPRQGQVRSLPRTGPSMSKQAGRSGGSFPPHEAPVPATEQGEPFPSQSRSSTLGTPYRRAGRALEGRAPSQAVLSTSRDPRPCPAERDPRLTEVTGGPCAPRGTQALAGNGVTGCPCLAVTPLVAALSERARCTPWWGAVRSASLPVPCPTRQGQGSTWEGRALTPLAELAGEAGGADTLTADGVTRGSLLTLTHGPAASPVEARGTG